MLDYRDNIAIGTATLVPAALLSVYVHSSIGYIALGASVYFIIVGVAGFAGLRGSVVILAQMQQAVQRKRLSRSELLEMVHNRSSKNDGIFAAAGLPVQVEELLRDVEERFGLQRGNALLRDELALALQGFEESGELHIIGGSLSAKRISYTDEVARRVYDSAMLDGKFLLGNSARGILAKNRISACNGPHSDALDMVSPGKPAVLMVPNEHVRRMLAEYACRYDPQCALLCFGLASGALEVRECC